METAKVTKYENGPQGPAQLSPEHIMKIGTGFWASKT